MVVATRSGAGVAAIRTVATLPCACAGGARVGAPAHPNKASVNPYSVIDAILDRALQHIASWMDAE
jgi:hypothetical protein